MENTNAFETFSISREVVDNLKKHEILTPTDIQAKAIPVIEEGSDVVIQSHTGSGKTFAYLLPVINKIIKEQIVNNYCIVLVPTYELAAQVKTQVELLCENISGIGCTMIIGDANINRQIDTLKSKPQIIIGTAGRIIELIKKKKIAAHLVKYLVIDEADKMLDKNNYDNTYALRKCLMKDAQVLAVSASITNETRKVYINILCQPKEVIISNQLKYSQNIEHIFIVENRDKINMLMRIIHNVRPKKALVFINKAYDIDLASKKLNFNNIKAEYIHGDDSKIKRKNTLEKFRHGDFNILLCTDMAARGLQIDGIDTVINYTIPEKSTDYLHRSGRCGRNGNKGISISIIEPKEKKYINQYKKELKLEFKEKELYKGKLVNIRKEGQKPKENNK